MSEQPAQHDLILVHYGELGLKGQNRPQFRSQLRQNLRCKLKARGLDWPVEPAGSYFNVFVPRDQAGMSITPALTAVQEVFGIAWLAPVRYWRRNPNAAEPPAAELAALQTHLIVLANEQYAAGKTFAVRVNRADKSFPFTSPKLESRLGNLIRQQTKWDKVNLLAPDVTFYVDLRRDVVHLFSEKLKGPGGLPVGTSGRVLALLSGGIDSPVAAWLMAKRGCRVDFIHFTAAAMQPEEAQQYKVCRLAQRLSEYTLGSRLFLVPYTHFDLALMREPVDYNLVLFRRFMSRVAEQLARRLNVQALATGDNLGQVASQTLSNLVSTSRAVELPIFRPLLGYDKDEITALAQRIGTYQMSIEPYKDCCALIAQHPRTRSHHERLATLEARVFADYQKLIDQTLAEAVCLRTEDLAQALGEVKSGINPAAATCS